MGYVEGSWNGPPNIRDNSEENALPIRWNKVKYIYSSYIEVYKNGDFQTNHLWFIENLFILFVGV